MPLKEGIRKVMVIGSGPIVIGQAAEFDYAGTQACRALKEDGLEVVLVNSNPATIMTDSAIADHIYIEPLTLRTVTRIIEKERPDSLLSTLGGQTGLTLSMQLAKSGVLERYGVRLLGASPETIDRAEDRELFKETMQKIGQPVIPSVTVNDVESAIAFAGEIGYPLVIRPAFTLGGTGGGIVSDERELREICSNGLSLSPIHQVLVERCISGWKEIEFEVIRDSRGNVITVCSMENLDPVGIHTGDSIVVAPAVTLADREYQMLRTAALRIIDELGVEGGCNCQFALNPDSFEYAVIEVNPRVSRSSALASKATGYPIAKVATKIAIGYTLDEIPNAVTGTTMACFEPSVDYIVVKLPKWPFDKFVYAKRTLGTQMKATGEVMSIGTSFEQAIMKAVRGAEISHPDLRDKACEAASDDELRERLRASDDMRIFAVYEALRRGFSYDEIFEITKIDRWFLGKLRNLTLCEKELCECGEMSDELYLRAKKLGFTDSSILRISGKRPAHPRLPVYKMVDTCAAEFAAQTPYFYSTFDEENEAEDFIVRNPSGKKTVVVFGSGPIRIGQGIEFDYASVHCVWALKRAGYDVAIVNNNPETVSTDFDTADRLYFEPLTAEDVAGILAVEKPFGVVVAFGGQTAIKLTHYLDEQGYNILGTSADGIDAAEDRERFDELLEKLRIKRPNGFTVMTCEEALEAAEKVGYPVLLRPSYVLGGQNMIIAFGEDDVREYMGIILAQNIENPVLIDKYLSGTELEVDAICDGEDILIPGIMEHIERAGVHSGDSIAVYPAWNIDDEMTDRICRCTRELAVGLGALGLVNIQYLIYEGELYVIEVNPRSSRTIPYISKVTGVPMVDLATRAMLGEKLRDMGYGSGLYRTPPYVAVKVPVFSFEKLSDVDTQLGPEMKSTGEVLGLAATMDEAIYKGLRAAGYRMDKRGGVFITVRDVDKPFISETAKRFHNLGFEIYSTEGTAALLRSAGIPAITVKKIHQSAPDEINTLKLIESGKVNYVISTSSKGRIPTRDSVRIRRKAVERNVPCLTSIDTANALARSLESRWSLRNTELVDVCRMRTRPEEIPFVKMQSCGNDYIVVDCLSRGITNPNGIAVRFADRRYGIGGDGVAVILPSRTADACMRIFNPDGSEGEIGGNGLRCVGKYLYDHGIVPRRVMDIETAAGIRTVRVYTNRGVTAEASAEMGLPVFEPEKIPSTLDGERVIDRKVKIAGEEHTISLVSMGNPHCVVFRDDVDTLNIAEVGPHFENCELFPERINTEFCKIVDDHTIRMRVWERSVGETWACGTGACAAVVAAVENGFCRKGEEISVRLRGGSLRVTYRDDGITMRGDTVEVFRGTISI